jgi:lysyl-tRNA synthetase class 1
VGRPLTEIERRNLDQRIRSARVWVERFADEEEKTRLQETLPARAEALSPVQRAFLQQLAAVLPATPWEDDALQAKIFEVARLTPIEQAAAFKAIYRVLLDREAGPKAGNLLAFLDPSFVVKRFQELPVDRIDYWKASAITVEELEKWLADNRAKIADYSCSTGAAGEIGVYEIIVTLTDGKRQLNRILLNMNESQEGLLARLQPLTTAPPSSLA